MKLNGGYPVLFGYTNDGEETELYSIEEVAKYICDKGLHSDLIITTELDLPLLSTCGIYIDRIADMEYRKELLKILIPMQTNMVGCQCCEENGEEQWGEPNADPGDCGFTDDMQMT